MEPLHGFSSFHRKETIVNLFGLKRIYDHWESISCQRLEIDKSYGVISSSSEGKKCEAVVDRGKEEE